MAKLVTIFFLTIGIAKIHNKLYNTTSKLQKSVSSIGFNVTPKFAQINSQFIKKQDQIDTERKLML